MGLVFKEHNFVPWFVIYCAQHNLFITGLSNVLPPAVWEAINMTGNDLLKTDI